MEALKFLIPSQSENIMKQTVSAKVLEKLKNNLEQRIDSLIFAKMANDYTNNSPTTSVMPEVNSPQSNVFNPKPSAEKSVSFQDPDEKVVPPAMQNKKKNTSSEVEEGSWTSQESKVILPNFQCNIVTINFHNNPPAPPKPAKQTLGKNFFNAINSMHTVLRL